MTTVDDAPSVERAKPSFDPVVAAVIVATVVVILAYGMLAVGQARAGAPIKPWIHVLLAIVALGVLLTWFERQRRRILAELRATVQQLTAQPQPPQQAYLDGYLDATRERLAGQDATVIELHPRRPA